MIIQNAQRLQRLAEQLLALQRRLEAGSGDTSHIREGLEEVARRVGVDLDVLRIAHPDTVVEVLSPDGGGDPGKLWAAGEVLYLEGVRALAEDQLHTGRSALVKARLLLQALDSDLALPEGAHPVELRLEELNQLLTSPGREASS
jgi:hypothetical protein